MNIVTQFTLRTSLLISTVLFFNYMYRLIDASSQVGQQYHDALQPRQNSHLDTPQKDNVSTQPLQGKEHFHTWLMIAYLAFVMFKYKTLNEQVGIYLVFFVILNLAYYPFNCACRDPEGWVCKANTAPNDKRCKALIQEIEQIDAIVNQDLKNIQLSKKKLVHTLINNQFPVFPVPSMPVIPENAFNLPTLPPLKRVMPRIKFSCDMSADAIWNFLKKRVFNKIGKPFRKKKWGKRFRR